jgi:TatD DNase family protein
MPRPRAQRPAAHRPCPRRRRGHDPGLTEEFRRRPAARRAALLSSGRRLAEEAVRLGFYISFSGILTFKKADELREIARDVPADRILVETDAPYLAPIPHRGKRNEPAFVGHTAARLAEVRGQAAAEIEALTTDNFFRLFDRAQRPVAAG